MAEPGRQQDRTATTSGVERGRSFVVTAMIGVGLMAAIDEIVFHQILAWHHFYDRSTGGVALMSDGLLHAGELVLLVAGFFLFADLRRRHTLGAGWAWSGLFVGLGGFQLWDGLVDHKVLRIHQIRYDVDLLPYDLAWNGGAVVLLAIGAVIAWRTHAAARQEPVRLRSVPPEADR